MPTMITISQSCQKIFGSLPHSSSVIIRIVLLHILIGLFGIFHLDNSRMWIWNYDPFFSRMKDTINFFACIIFLPMRNIPNSTTSINKRYACTKDVACTVVDGSSTFWELFEQLVWITILFNWKYFIFYSKWEESNWLITVLLLTGLSGVNFEMLQITA